MVGAAPSPRDLTIRAGVSTIGATDGNTRATGRFKSFVLGSACPVEGRRESALARAVEFHAEGFDLRGGRPRDRDGGARRMCDPGQLGCLAAFLRRVVLDLDGHVVADADAVAVALVRVLDRQPLDPEDLADQRSNVR